MFFLEFVENPHIEKLYAPPKSPGQVEAFESRHRANVFVIKNFDVLRPSDWMVLVISAQCAVITFLLPIKTAVGVSLSIRIIGSLVVGVFLRQQGKCRFWTNQFAARGLTDQDAFQNWIRIYNCIDSAMNVTLLTCAARFFRPGVFLELWSSSGGGVVCAYLCMAVAFLWVSNWALESSYEILGDDGWFFGDFFLPVKKQKDLYSEGIYRYVTNPDIVLGKLWMYALVILTRSSTVCVLAFTAHLSWMFCSSQWRSPTCAKCTRQRSCSEHSTMITEKSIEDEEGEEKAQEEVFCHRARAVLPLPQLV